MFNRLGIKTFPASLDDWCLPTLTPPEGSWLVSTPQGATLELDWGHYASSPTGPDSSVRIGNVGNADRYNIDLRFRLHNTREFNATRQQTQIHFYLEANEGSNFITGHESRLRLYDASGRMAEINLITSVGVWEHFDIALGSDAPGWTVESGFDWHYIKEIAFARWGYLNNYLWVDQLYFSYYELIPPLLNINSEPSGYKFSYDSVIRTTPWYINPSPGVPTEIRMDPTNFVKWEDENTNPVRSITLAEGASKTITAYYSAPPPPPQDNNMLLLAGAAIIGIGLLFIMTRGFK